MRCSRFGLSSLCYTLNFFNSDRPGRQQLRQALEQVCNSAFSVRQMIEQDASKDRFEPENKCANGVFVYDFLYDQLNLPDSRLIGLKQIKGADIRWTAGFLLLSAAQQ